MPGGASGATSSRGQQEDVGLLPFSAPVPMGLWDPARARAGSLLPALGL